MILKNILPVAAVLLVMGLLAAAAKKKPKKDEAGNSILQLPKLYPGMGLLMIVVGLGLLVYAYFFANESDQILAIISSLIALIIGLLLFAKGYISHIKVTDLGITETTMFGKLKEIQWKDIKDVTFGDVSLELKIKSHDKSIKAHMHLIGFDELLAKLEEKTGKTKGELGIPE